MADALTAEQLLAELEPLAHHQRVRRMVELGRASTRDAAVASLLDTLERGGFYERWMALHACFGSGDGERALRGVSDPSRTIRRLAMRLIALAADDAQALAALRRATPSLLRPLLRLLARRRRRGPIDAFLAALAEAGDDRLEALLPFGSPEVVQRHLETATGRAGMVEWRRLAR